MNCAKCALRSCDDSKGAGRFPAQCPSLLEDVMAACASDYAQEENRRIGYNAALVEAEGYCKKTRLEEIIDFCRKNNFKKLGLAFCIGFSKEASVLNDILNFHGFDVASAICKNGRVPKSSVGIRTDQTIAGDDGETMCNPIGQARILNEAHTEFNIILGLCVGHDSLMIKYSEALVTTFAVKDRVLAHNPLGAIYLADGYYHDKLYNKLS